MNGKDSTEESRNAITKSPAPPEMVTILVIHFGIFGVFGARMPTMRDKPGIVTEMPRMARSANAVSRSENLPICPSKIPSRVKLKIYVILFLWRGLTSAAQENAHEIHDQVRFTGPRDFCARDFRAASLRAAGQKQAPQPAGECAVHLPRWQNFED